MKTLTKMEQSMLCHGVIPRGVQPGTFVPLAAATARVITGEELEDPHSLEKLYVVKGRLQRTLHSAFPVEEQVRNATNRTLELVTRQIVTLEQTPVYNLPTIDPRFLSWKTEKGYPGFAIYSLTDPVCKIIYTRSGNMPIIMSPELPKLVSRYYLDDCLLENLRRECGIGRIATLTLTAKYAGAMPQDVRDKIRFYSEPDCFTPRFDAMFIITEAPDWSREVVREILVGDPLVVGIKHGLMWLVATYDLTPTEEFVHSLCSTAVDKSGN